MNEKLMIFIKECKKNRKYLEYTSKDICNCLVDVSEKEYEDFENGQYMMSKDNLDRLTKVLNIKKHTDFNINKYIDVREYDEDEINDLSVVISTIVGEDND